MLRRCAPKQPEPEVRVVLVVEPDAEKTYEWLQRVIADARRWKAAGKREEAA